MCVQGVCVCMSASSLGRVSANLPEDLSGRQSAEAEALERPYLSQAAQLSYPSMFVSIPKSMVTVTIDGDGDGDDHGDDRCPMAMTAMTDRKSRYTPMISSSLLLSLRLPSA